MEWLSWIRRAGRSPSPESPASPPLMALARDAFVSYSRRDIHFVDELERAVTDRKGTLWIDRRDIPPASEFWKDIQRGIEESSNFIFLLTEHSVRSPNCLFELRHAVSRGKRLIPFRPGARDTPPPDELAHIQEFFWDTGASADENSQRLLNVLRTEPEFVEQHGELLRRALRWKRSGQAPGELLSRKLLRSAEQWLEDVAVSTSPQLGLPRPRATRLIQRYVQESRRRLTRRLQLSGAVGLLALLTAAGGWGWVTSTPYQFLQLERESPGLVALVLNEPRAPRRDEVLEQHVAALAAHGKVQEAIEATEDMWPAQRASARARIVETLVRAGALPEALRVRALIDTSPSGTMSPRTPAEVLAAASEASFALGESERARQELQAAFNLAGQIPAQSGKSAALELRDPVFARILAARVRQRKIGEALDGLSSVGHPDTLETTLVHLVKLAAELWTAQDVLPLAQAIADGDERAMALGSAARRLRERGLHEDAAALEDEALQAVQGSEDPLALVQVGRWLVARRPALAEQTLLAARDVARRQNRVDERLQVAVGFMELGRQEEAATDIREALALMDSETYERGQLLDGLVRVGKLDLARELAGDSPGDLLQLVITLAELGRLAEAEALAPRIQGVSEQSSAFYALAHAFTARGDYRRARDYASRCRPIERMTAYSEFLLRHSLRQASGGPPSSAHPR